MCDLGCGYKMIIMRTIQAISPTNIPTNIKDIIKDCRDNKRTIVLITGVFDVLHKEHEEFLRKAKNLADKLVVGIESDVRVKQLKGESRPINSQDKRVDNLANLKVIDEIFILPDNFNKHQDHIDLIKTIRPAILAVSSHTAHLEEKKKIMDMVSGKIVIIHQQNPEVSSTKLINGDC